MTPACLETAVKTPVLHWAPMSATEPSSPFSLCNAFKCLSPTSHLHSFEIFSSLYFKAHLNFSKSYLSFHISAFFGKMRLAHLTNHISISSRMVSGALCDKASSCLFTYCLPHIWALLQARTIMADSLEYLSACHSVFCDLVLNSTEGPPVFHVVPKDQNFPLFFPPKNVFSTQKARK